MLAARLLRLLRRRREGKNKKRNNIFAGLLTPRLL
jgi:hypothetical protein